MTDRSEAYGDSHITIPPEALAAARNAYFKSTRLSWQGAVEDACFAMLRAWPGMSTGPNIYGRQDAVMHLPLTTETQNG